MALALLPVLATVTVMSAPAHADAPRDIQTNQRLWLDGLDVNGTDTGNAAVTNLRVRFGGTFASGTSPNFPSLTLKYGLVIK